MANNLRLQIESFIHEVTELRVAVVGETIIDEFVEVVYEGHSMKSFCPVFRLVEGRPKSVQQGGAAAIAGHLRDFVKVLSLFQIPIQKSSRHGTWIPMITRNMSK